MSAKTGLRTWTVAAVGALSLLAGAARAQGSAPDAGGMTAAAQQFLATLDAAQRAQTKLAFNSAARLDWGYVPRQRPGLPLKQMTPATREAAVRLLRSTLSLRGAQKVDAIVALEEVLRAVEGWSGRDSGLYYVTVFGDPAERGAWGWRYEGHHLSLNWTLKDGRVVGSSPQFLGANPAEVRSGPQRGGRALALEEDLARSLVASLGPAQRARAVLAPRAPADIVTGSAREAAVLEARGLPWTELDAEKQGFLLSLLQEYASTQAPAVAEARLARVRSELASVVFAWMGGLRQGEGHYYRVQGSSFLVEYDNTQNGANHIHSVWREFHGDWGKDLLSEHYRSAPHHAPSAVPRPAL